MGEGRQEVGETCFGDPGGDVWSSENVTEAWVEEASFRDATETVALVEVFYPPTSVWPSLDL